MSAPCVLCLRKIITKTILDGAMVRLPLDLLAWDRIPMTVNVCVRLVFVLFL